MPCGADGASDFTRSTASDEPASHLAQHHQDDQETVAPALIPYATTAVNGKWRSAVLPSWECRPELGSRRSSIIKANAATISTTALLLGWPTHHPQTQG
jgi:hypothetical protein